MSIAGVAALFRGTPVHPVGDDGRMALSDHLRELRARVLKAAVVIIVGFAVALFFFQPLFDLITHPYLDAVKELGDRSQGVTNGPAAGFMLYLKLAGLAALVGTSPVWLYQIWAFLMPGLHPNERRWTRIFVAIAGPLFIVGVVLGYYTMPKGLEILIGFNPQGWTNLVDFDEYLSFLSRTLLVFGIAFEIPVFVVLLNRAGIISGKALGKYRSWMIVGTFVFAAVATPSGDPFTMTIMAVPMVALFLASEIIARTNDKRRERRREAVLGEAGVPSTIDS